MPDPPKKWLTVLLFVCVVVCAVAFVLFVLNGDTRALTVAMVAAGGFTVTAFPLRDRAQAEYAARAVPEPADAPYRFWLHWPTGQGQVRVLMATESEVAEIVAVRPVIGPYESYRAADLDTLRAGTYADLRPYTPETE